MEIVIAVIAMTIVIVIASIMFYIMNRQLHNSELKNQKMLIMMQQMEGRFQEFELSNEQKLENMRGTLMQGMSRMQSDKNQSFDLVGKQLEQVHKSLGEMKNLAEGVGDLKKVLSNVKTRGILGEIQLGAILEEIFSPEQYEEDIEVIPGSKRRVEFAVKFPGSGDDIVYLPIDSKFPADAYFVLQEAYESGDKTRIEMAATALTQRLRSFAKDIHQKYIEPPFTTDFGIMFLPFEGLYAEAVNRGMIEILQREYKVNLVGPSTMAAMLNSMQMGFRTLAIQKRSSEVWQLLSAVKTEFDKFDVVLNNTKQRMEQAGNELDQLVGVRTRQIQKHLNKVEQMKNSDK